MLPPDIKRLILTYCTEPIYNINPEINENILSCISTSVAKSSRIMLKTIKYIKAILPKSSIKKHIHELLPNALSSHDPKIIRFVLEHLDMDKISRTKSSAGRIAMFDLSNNQTMDPESIRLIDTTIENFIKINPKNLYWIVSRTNNLRLISKYFDKCFENYYELPQAGSQWIYDAIRHTQSEQLVERVMNHPNINKKLLSESVSSCVKLFGWLNTYPEYISIKELFSGPKPEILLMIYDICNICPYVPTAHTINIFNVVKSAIKTIDELPENTIDTLYTSFLFSLHDVKNMFQCVSYQTDLLQKMYDMGYNNRAKLTELCDEQCIKPTNEDLVIKYPKPRLIKQIEKYLNLARQE